MEFQDKQAIYLQIADYICEKILRKVWNDNDKIPSVRELAVNIEVNPNTVIRAYTFLEDQAIIFKQRGVGYFISQDAYNKTLRLKKEVFLKQDLPFLFNALELLKIDFSELQSLLVAYQRQNIAQPLMENRCENE